MFTLSWQYCWHCLLCNLSNHRFTSRKETTLLPCLAFCSLEDVNIQRMQKLLHTLLLTYLTQQQQGGRSHRNDTKVNPCDNLCQSYFWGSSRGAWTWKKTLLPLAGFWLVNVHRQDAVPLAWLDGGEASWAQVQPTGTQWGRPAPWIQVVLFQGDFQKFYHMDTRWTCKGL